MLQAAIEKRARKNPSANDSLRVGACNITHSTISEDGFPSSTDPPTPSPPFRPSPLPLDSSSGRTFADSLFLTAYRRPESKVRFLHQLMTSVYELIQLFGKSRGLDVEEMDLFFSELQREAVANCGKRCGRCPTEFTEPGQLVPIAVRVASCVYLAVG
ncbi:MAG: hypothetical protein SGPRY_011947 [Prymnesium sp.]